MKKMFLYVSMLFTLIYSSVGVAAIMDSTVKKGTKRSHLDEDNRDSQGYTTPHQTTKTNNETLTNAPKRLRVLPKTSLPASDNTEPSCFKYLETLDDISNTLDLTKMIGRYFSKNANPDDNQLKSSLEGFVNTMKYIVSNKIKPNLPLSMVDNVNNQITAAFKLVLNRARPYDGVTPLIMAVNHGLYKTTDYLLEEGANPNVSDSFSCAALHYTAKNRAYELVGLLLDHGANPNAVNDSNQGAQTPLDIAVENNDYHTTRVILCSGHVTKRNFAKVKESPVVEDVLIYHDISLVDETGKIIPYKI